MANQKIHGLRYVVIAVVLLIACTSHVVLGNTAGRVLEYNLREEVPRGSFVGNVKHDSNMTNKLTTDQAHRLRFEFRHPTAHPYQYFTIDDKRGIIHTAYVLDREDICLHSSTCDLALDVKVKPVEFFQVFKVVVHIVDINDNTPTFPQDRISISVAETTMPGALFLVPTAEDADSDLLGVQEYQLMSDTDVFELKVTDYVDGSKDIRLKLMKRLDREEEDKYTMTVYAVDGGRPRKTGSVVIDVVVLDSNDNNPRFENSSYEVTIYENLPVGTLVAGVRATDPDHGQSGVVTYSFADYTERDYGSVFRIDDRTGEIYLRGQVDYETARFYQLTVIATDMGSGSLPVFAKVSINVLDLNDNPPSIVVNVLTESEAAQVRENVEPGTFVAHAAVKDSDSGPGGETECSIDGRGLFRLEALYDSEYKLITMVTFDREEADHYTVMMTCRDNGAPSLTSSVAIEIKILDENDNSPMMPSNTIVIEMRENNIPGSIVTTINASDADAGKNCALLYRIQPLNGTPENILSVDPIMGRVASVVSFDYEKRHDYRFLVTVFDHGDVPHSATATLQLYVIDVNDEKPRFDKSSYYFTTMENRPIGTSVGLVNATDLDLTKEFRQVEYQMLEAGTAFEVHIMTGEIYNVKRIDRELQSIYHYILVAYNEGFPMIRTLINVTIEVLDDNDNNPVFVFPSRHSKSVEISTSAGVGALVTRIHANDSDLGANAEITYSIQNGNVEGIFDIQSSTGVIVLAKELQDVSRLYKLVVVAKDSGQPPLMTVDDLSVVANASAALLANSAVDRLTATFFSGNNMLILVGAGAGFILIVICLVLAIVCVKRHNRRSREKFLSQIMSSNSPCSHQCQSPVCSSKISRGRPEGSLTTVDTCSERSGGGLNPYRIHSGCECREMTLEEDDEYTLDPWNHQDSRVIPNSHMVNLSSDDPQSTPPSFRGVARCVQRERSRSPRANFNHQCGGVGVVGGGGGGSGCCHCSSSQMQRRHYNLPVPHHSCRNHSRPQSPEYIPLKVNGSGGVVQDSGSLCSWPDSGRGPSEEDDQQKLQLDPLLKDVRRGPCCNHQCNHQNQCSTGTI